MTSRFLVPGVALALASLSFAQGGAQTQTASISCNGEAIGSVTLKIEPYNFTRTAGGVTKRYIGANAVGGFALTNAGARDANCWCESYRWFQAINLTDPGNIFGNGAPAFGFNQVADPFPATPIQWGGGGTTGDFYPFYWGNPNGGCGHNSATGRNPIPGQPGKTYDLYYEDGPGVTFNQAGAPANFSVTLDFVTCLACVSSPLNGNGRNVDGSFKVLGAIRWSVTFGRSAADGWTSTIGAPTVVAPNALPGFVQTSLTNFNNRPGVGTWTITNNCAPCPPPAKPPLGTPRLLDPGMDFGLLPVTFDPLSGMLEIPEMQPMVLDDMGFDGPTPPRYQFDPLLDASAGSLQYRYVGLIGGDHVFMNDTQHWNLHLDDPLDQPDQTLFTDADFQGNPNGWETFITGHAPLLVYDPLQQLFFAPLLDPYLDPLASVFMQDLGAAILPPQLPLALQLQPLVDPLQATQGFTQPAQMPMGAVMTPMDLPQVGQPYCPGVPNSTGLPTQLHATGTAFAQDDLLYLHTTDMPLDQFGFIVNSNGQIFLPQPGGSQGNLCVGPNIGRGVGQVIFSSGPFGASTVAANLPQMPTPNALVPVLPGQTWTFQTWHRDFVNGQPTSNFSNALQIQFQ